MIGHKGKNGLYALLRSSGWAHHLVASHKSFAKGFSLFLISIQLTESGERFIDDVISVVFQFINLLKASGPLQWFYEELKYLTVQQFEQQEADRPQNYASNIAVSIVHTILDTSKMCFLEKKIHFINKQKINHTTSFKIIAMVTHLYS